MQATQPVCLDQALSVEHITMEQYLGGNNILNVFGASSNDPVTRFWGLPWKALVGKTWYRDEFSFRTKTLGQVFNVSGVRTLWIRTNNHTLLHVVTRS